MTDNSQNEATWQLLDRATAQRKLLLDAGYVPVPANGKAPPMKAWSSLQPTSADIERWEQEYREATNTGILTRNTPAVDIDVLDPDVAGELQNLLWSTIGNNGHAMVRFGRVPKRAILFQTDAPFSKFATPTFTSPDQCKHRVEVLCDGQQIIVFGQHPDTGQNYTWSNGEPGRVEHDDLPYLNEAMARDFVAKATELIRAKGWTEDKSKKGNGQAATFEQGADFDALYGGREQKYALAALDGCTTELAGTTKGERNAKLNAAAYRMGTLIARQWVGRDEVISRLLLAAHACGLVADDGEAAARRTLLSGLEAGEAKPHADLGDRAAIDTKADTKQHDFQFLDMTAWDDHPPPPREWAVHEVIPLRAVTLLSGAGGVGKSLIGMTLAAAHALARDWFGTLPEPGPAIYFNAEDEADELHRRLAAIREHYGVRFADMVAGGLHIIARAGKDTVLGQPDRNGIIRPTLLFNWLHEQSCIIRPKQIMIDHSAKVFAGNENDPAQVTQFGTLLHGLAINANTAVVLAAHPSLAGINSGTGLSGSTAWEGTVRARLYLKHVETEKGDQPDSNLRVLEAKKANYGPNTWNVNLRWRDGLFKLEPTTGSLEKLAAEQTVNDLFLTLLRRFTGQGRNVSPSRSPTYAPTQFANQPEAKAVKTTAGALAEAMERLLAANKIRVVSEGSPSRKRDRIEEVQA
jgi:RecA-family ATPase